MKQRMEDTNVDLLTSVLLHTLSALPITEDEEPDLSLISASAITLGGQGSPEDKTRKARAALIRNNFERLPSCTNRVGSPYGRLQCVGDFTLHPFPPSLSAGVSISPTAVKQAPPSESGAVVIDTLSSDSSFTRTALNSHENNLGLLQRNR